MRNSAAEEEDPPGAEEVDVLEIIQSYMEADTVN